METNTLKDIGVSLLILADKLENTQEKAEMDDLYQELDKLIDRLNRVN